MGSHYHQRMRVRKEGFATLVKIRFKQKAEKEQLDGNLITKFEHLVSNPSNITLANLIISEEFIQVYNKMICS